MTDVFNHLDILVHFRRDEGFGLVLAEAMACKIPVVSVKGGGIDEVITTGITGLLVDSLKEMPGAIRKILTDRRLRKSISDTARLAALNEFSVQRQTAEYQKVFESLFR
jgi:glycosyltransferase involved in cell wall biosynthesis